MSLHGPCPVESGHGLNSERERADVAHAHPTFGRMTRLQTTRGVLGFSSSSVRTADQDAGNASACVFEALARTLADVATGGLLARSLLFWSGVKCLPWNEEQGKLFRFGSSPKCAVWLSSPTHYTVPPVAGESGIQ